MPYNKQLTNLDFLKSKSHNPLHNLEWLLWKTKTPRLTWNPKSSYNPPNLYSRTLWSRPSPIKSQQKARNSSPSFIKKTNDSNDGKPTQPTPWTLIWHHTRGRMGLESRGMPFMEVAKSLKEKSMKKDFLMWIKGIKK